MNESVKPKPPAQVERPPVVDSLSTVDSIVRNMTREQEAAGELAAGLREVLRGDPVVENAKRVTKGVDTLQIVAAVLFQDHDRGGTGGAKTALQDHLVELKALSTKCSSRIDFADEAELHQEAFRLCKLLESTPRLLTNAMNISFEVLVDLNSSHAQSVAAHKKSLLTILRNFGQAYAEIASMIQIPDLRLPNSADVKKQVWSWYRWLAICLWLFWIIRLGMRGPVGFFASAFYGVLAYWLGTLVISKLMPVFEDLALKFHRRRLAELGILPDKRGKYSILPNGLSFAPDYDVLKALLLARGHDWDEFHHG